MLYNKFDYWWYDFCKKRKWADWIDDNIVWYVYTKPREYYLTVRHWFRCNFNKRKSLSYHTGNPIQHPPKLHSFQSCDLSNFTGRSRYVSGLFVRRHNQCPGYEFIGKLFARWFYQVSQMLSDNIWQWPDTRQFALSCSGIFLCSGIRQWKRCYLF